MQNRSIDFCYEREIVGTITEVILYLKFATFLGQELGSSKTSLRYLMNMKSMLSNVSCCRIVSTFWPRNLSCLITIGC